MSLCDLYIVIYLEMLGSVIQELNTFNMALESTRKHFQLDFCQ